jgi:hypothetical protein
MGQPMLFIKMHSLGGLTEIGFPPIRFSDILVWLVANFEEKKQFFANALTKSLNVNVVIQTR